MKLFALAAVFAFGVVGHAQDAETTLPGVYKLQFENDWVKVVRVHYAPHVKLPSHAHTRMASAYVYLSDSGPVVFRHIGAEYGSATRPPVKAGTFRLWRAIGEMHEVENTSPLASDFLRVEFKTEPKEERTLRGRYHREPLPPDGIVERVQFENAQIRITRYAAASGMRFDLRRSEAPSLVVALTDLPGLAAGRERWIREGEAVAITNAAAAPIELLRFEFLTLPKKGSGTISREMVPDPFLIRTAAR